MRSVDAQCSSMNLMDDLEPRRILAVGYFSAGIDINMSPGSESAFVYNDFGDYDSATGDISFSSRDRSDGTFDSIDVESFSVTTKLRSDLVFSAGGDGASEFDWTLSDASLFNVGTPVNNNTRLSFNTSFTSTDLRLRLVTRQATDLTLADRDGSYAFSGIIYDSDAWAIFPSYGSSTVTNGNLTGSEFTAFGEVPLSAIIGENDAFDDGFTRSNVPGYTSLYSSRFSTLTTGFNQGPDNNFNSLSYAIRTDGTQPGQTDLDAFRGDEFNLTLFGFQALFPELFAQGFQADGGMAQSNVVLQFDPSGNRAHFYNFDDFYGDLDAQPISTGTWELGAGLGLRYQTDDGFSINLRYGGDNGDELVGEMISDGANSQPVFAVGSKFFDGAPATDGGGGGGGGDTGGGDGGGDGGDLNEAPTDVGVCFKSSRIVFENGEHFILADGDNGVTYSWKVRDIEGSTEGYLGVGTSLQDDGKTIVALVTRVDGEVRELKRKEDGEWRVKNPVGGAVLSSNVMVAPTIETNLATGQQSQMAFGTDGSARMILPSTTDEGSPEVASVNIQNGSLNFAPNLDISRQFDGEYTVWGAFHAAYVSDTNEIFMLWNSPEFLGSDLRFDNIQSNAGAPAPASDARLSVATTSFGSIHVGYESADGEYGHLYWNIGQGGNWRYASLENAVGAPSQGLNFDPSTAVTGFDVLGQRIFVAGVDATSGLITAVDWRLDRQQWQYNEGSPADQPDMSFAVDDFGFTSQPVAYSQPAITGVSNLFMSNANAATPVLSNIPFINVLFNNTGLERQSNDLVIIVTPTLAGGGG